MNLVVPFGFYGAGNIGDESTLQGFARLVARSGNGTRVRVASRNPVHTARIEPSFKYYRAIGHDPRSWWARYQSEAYAIVGGTPIMDVLGAWPLSEVAPLVSAARAEGKPIVFVGTGTEGLQQEESRRIISGVLAPAVKHWSVRSASDRKRLVSYGVSPDQVTVAADLAWSLEPVSPDFGRQYLKRLGVNGDQPLFGVNVNNEGFVLEQAPHLFETIARGMDVLVEKYDAKILFLCNEVREDESFDKAAARQVLARMRHRDRAVFVPNEYWSPQQMLSLIGNCRATLSTRYHFCLFSALQGVPFIAIKRSDKVGDLCWDMNWPYEVSLSAAEAPRLLDMFSEIEVRRQSLVRSLGERVLLMRKRAFTNMAALKVLEQPRIA